MYKRIVTANSGDNTLSIIDLKDTVKIEKIELKKIINNESNLRPLAITVDNEKILIVNSLNDSLYKISIKEKKLLKSVKVGRYPIDVLCFKDKIYVLNSESSSISIINRENFAVLESIFIGGYLTDIKLDKENGNIYVANWEKNSISKIDMYSNKVTNTSFLLKPFKIVIVNEYLFILSSFNNKYANYCELLKISLKNNKIIDSVRIKGIYCDLTKREDKENFILVNPEEATLVGVNYKNSKIIKEKYIGGLPSRIRADNKYIYTNDLINNNIIILDINNYSIKDKFRVGKEPQGLLLL